VLDKVQELNYTPNLAARSLVTGRTYLVGLVVPNLLHSFFAEIARSLSAALLKKGYCLTISTTEEDQELEEKIISRLESRRLDALIIASAQSKSSTLERIQKQGPPLVLIDRRFPALETNYVGVDDERVGELATEHLIEVGCKRIAHLRGPDTSCGRGRVAGYQKALAAAGFKLVAGYVSAASLADAHGIEQGEELTRQLLTQKPRPDGIFAFNDSMAIGALHVLQAAGLRVPEDVAVIGAGNLYYDKELRVPLSTIDQQTTLAGERTAKLVLALLDAKTPQRSRTVLLEPHLMARKSTERKAAARRSKQRS